MQENDTPIDGETVTPEAQGITETPATDSSVQEPENTVEDTVSKEELSRVQKELEQLKMERNLLRNKQEEDRKKQLLEENEFKTLYEETQAELAQIKADKEEQEALEQANKLRSKFINEYPDPTVRKAAEKLVEKNPSNLSWGNVETEEDARQAIHSQLDAIRESLGIVSEDTEDTDVSITANNPSVRNTTPDDMSWEQMRELLPKADPR